MFYKCKARIERMEINKVFVFDAQNDESKECITPYKDAVKSVFFLYW